MGAMVRALVESRQRGRRLPVQNKIMLRRRNQLEEDNALMFGVADQMISDRRRNPSPPGSEDRSKRHIEIALPDGMRYRTGDYLAVLPLNPSELVQRALTRFNLDYDAHILLSMEQGDTFLPTAMPVSVGELLSSYVEFAVPATRIQLEYLADVADNPAQRRELESLAEDRERHATEILDKRVSLLDLLETNPSCQLSFSSFLQLLTQLSPRRYSISSSPLWSPDHATLTFTVIQAPAWSGRGCRLHLPRPGQARVTGCGHRAPLERGLPLARVPGRPAHHGLRRDRAGAVPWIRPGPGAPGRDRGHQTGSRPVRADLPGGHRCVRGGGRGVDR